MTPALTLRGSGVRNNLGDNQVADHEQATQPPPVLGRVPFARTILAVLVLVSILNFVDRQILSILASRIKTDLLISDTQLGFLFGTAFAIFYAVFGVPLGVYADLGSRKKLIAWGLALWSAMTVLSGLASGFAGLAFARVGVGIGEASCSPAAYSLIADLFPRARRATALAIYSLGIYIGIGLGNLLGGYVVDGWSIAFPPGQAPFGLRGWQAAFILAGLPGLLLAPIVGRLREPLRGGLEGATTASHQDPLGEALREGLALVPPFSFLRLSRDGTAAGLRRNLSAFLILALLSAAVSLMLDDPVQWTCLAFGAYVMITMAQRLKAREPDAHALIFKTPSLRLATLGFSFLSFTGYAIGFWMAPFFIRFHGFSAAEIGWRLALISAIGGGLGVTAGGALADWLRLKTPNGRLMVGMMNALLPLPLLAATLSTGDRTSSLALFFAVQVFAAMWLGAGSSTVQDLVLPHMRARASAVFLLFVTLIGLALGPYAVGRLSDLWGDLRLALMAASIANGIAFIFFVLATKTIEADEATKLERVRTALASLPPVISKG